MVRKRRTRRRGAAYLVVLGAALIIGALGYSAILVTRARARMAQTTADAAQARQIARDAIELGKLWISQDPNWRTNRTPGVWASNMVLGGGTFTLEATDPVDGTLSGWPHDPLVLQVTAVKGNARHVVQVTLEADPVPMPALQYAIHTAGQVHIHGGKNIDTGGGILSTNGSLRNDGTVTGSIDVGSVSPLGTVTGAKVIGSPAKPLPATTIIDTYAALGTQINPGSTMDKVVLGPGRNPYGTPDAKGLYVVRPTGDFTVKNTRVLGTLVIILPPGKKVTLDNTILIQPTRSDMPALLVKGEAKIHHTAGLLALQELTLGMNLNPVGAPYNGISDSDVLDSYPSEIQGLVHVTAQAALHQTATIRGTLISNSTGNDSVDVNDFPSVLFQPGIYANPPMFYTTRVDMPVQRGSWRQLAN
jgi:Tfp pilus assembly protein PilX